MTTPQILLFVLLVAVAAGAAAYAALEPSIATGRKNAQRLQQYKGAQTDGTVKRQERDRVQELVKRRKSIQTSLKEIEDKQREHDKHMSKPTLRRRLEQTGRDISIRKFVIASILSGLTFGFVGLILNPQPLFALGLAIVGGFGLPRWTINRMRKKRQQKFIEEFPNAIDLIIRGVKSGLPLNDTLRIISTEAAEPVRTEFRKIVEAQQMNMTTADAVARLYQNIPLPETNFFSIVISIQAQAGGNLSDALGNLSRVLRDRKKMRAKIQAMSMEAKASASIIGSLPIFVGTLVYLITPAYIMLLFTERIGNVVLLGSALWMMIGILIMKKMIAFDI